MSSKKPIYLYLTTFFPSEKSWRGGYFYDAVKALMKDGRYDVRVLVLSSWCRDGTYEYKGVSVRTVRVRHWGSAQYLETFFARANNRLFFDALGRMAVTPKDVTVCHVHDYDHLMQYAIVLKELNPMCKTLVHHHFSGRYDFSIGKFGVVPIWSDLLYLKMRREFAKMDAHIFISEDCRRHFGTAYLLEKDFANVDLRKTLPLGWCLPRMFYRNSYVWYNGVDKDVFHPEPRKRTGDGAFTVGYIANYNIGKCHYELIQAFELVLRKLPNARLRLIGSGSPNPVADSAKEYARCVRFVHEHKMASRVDFIREVDHLQLPEFYRSLDLFVMPSVNEGFCCVNAEANACGIPVIACKGLPIEELLDTQGREKWLVAPRDVKGFADRILSYVQAPATQEFVVDLDVNRLAKDYLNWLEAL